MRPHIKISLFLLACIALYFVARFAFAGNGILELDSQPGGADVFVDGKMKGVTPEMPGQKLTMELSEGEHEVVFKKEGLGSARKMVIVAAGVIQPLTLTLISKGILELTSYRGAEVFVDGKRIGAIPVTNGNRLTMELPEGAHEVAIKMENVGSANTNVFIEADTTQRLRLPLTITGEAFTNSLGMKFVRVPGTKVLMCIHETRNKDYAAFAAENSWADMSWRDVSFDTGNKKYTIEDDAEHPVVNVSYDDAGSFCFWLLLKGELTYRLPTDHEWSCAVGIGEQENASDTPEAKSGKVLGFPWGDSYPPPNNNVGNYGDSTFVKNGDMGSYGDGYLLTAPVMSYPANKLGIFDLGGNVWEWCEDQYSPTNYDRVVRGGSWNRNDRDYLASSYRSRYSGRYRNVNYGFRCVVIGSSP